MKSNKITLFAVIVLTAFVLLSGCTSKNEAGDNSESKSNINTQPTYKETESFSQIETVQNNTDESTSSSQNETIETVDNNTSVVSIFGRYTVDSIIDSNTGERQNPQDVFGSAYKATQKSITFYEDKTFKIDVGVYKSEDDISGTFELSEDKSVINASYNNGRKNQFAVTYDGEKVLSIAVPFGTNTVYFK